MLIYTRFKRLAVIFAAGPFARKLRRVGGEAFHCVNIQEFVARLKTARVRGHQSAYIASLEAPFYPENELLERPRLALRKRRRAVPPGLNFLGIIIIYYPFEYTYVYVYTYIYTCIYNENNDFMKLEN